jgi:hypothetical protein
LCDTPSPPTPQPQAIGKAIDQRNPSIIGIDGTAADLDAASDDEGGGKARASAGTTTPSAESVEDPTSASYDPHRLPGWRGTVLDFVDSLPFQVFLFLLILIDAALLVVDIAAGAKGTESSPAWWASLVIISILMVELLVRLAAERLAFFRSMWNLFDTVIVAASFVLLFANPGESHPRLILLLRLGRGILRIVRVIGRLARSRQRLRLAARRRVTKNKQRTVWKGYDLDLAYVTETVAVMSVPATGRRAFFRNALSDVARYLDQRHGPNGYHIFNVTSEERYDESRFHSRVTRYPVADHDPPAFALMLDFCAEAQSLPVDDLTGEPQVLVVHCKGGKGRSGTMIAAHLLASQVCTQPDEAMDLFAEKRTDPRIPGKRQGIETPSQLR